MVNKLEMLHKMSYVENVLEIIGLSCKRTVDLALNLT